MRRLDVNESNRINVKWHHGRVQDQEIMARLRGSGRLVGIGLALSLLLSGHGLVPHGEVRLVATVCFAQGS